ncbi:MAG: proline dehydrogenase family protein, partial [Nitrospira sp.]
MPVLNDARQRPIEIERKQRRAFTLDLLGEAVTSEREAERYLQEYLGLIETIAPVANSWPESPQV